MGGPKAGDVILRGSRAHGFSVIDAATFQPVAGPTQFSQAILLARAHGRLAVWQ